MQPLKLYLGLLGSGKTHIAKQYCETQASVHHVNAYFVEVSSLVMIAATQRYGGSPTREQLQKLKFDLQDQPRWLADALITEIRKAPKNAEVVISGLREVALYEELEALFGFKEIVIVEADAELRRKRRGYTVEEFKAATERDAAIGLDALLQKVKPIATFVENNFEWTKV